MTGWYVIQVQTGCEETVAANIRQVASDGVVKECFTPRWQTQQKLRGEWRYVVRNLIPGYVIAVSDAPEKLASSLQLVPGLRKILKSGEKIVPLAADEVEWFNRFTQRGERIVPMSSAIKEGDEVIITDGPLREQCTKITRLDRRRSTAYIEISILGRTKEVPVGLKVVAKRGG